jgi:Bax protein
MKYLSLIRGLDWRYYSLLCGAALFPVLLALLLSGFVPARQLSPFAAAVTPLEPVPVLAAEDLESLFDNAGYHWPPGGHVPPLAVRHFPHDIAALAVPRKKALFFRALLPLVVAENQRVRAERQWLETVARNGGPAGEFERQRLQRLLQEYALQEDGAIDATLLAKLQRRIDTLPPGLVLAQAANESGWGTSRFSREANNLFGEWTYSAEEGLLPLQRREGANHYVRRFDSLLQSVRSYLNNLNTHRAYRELRGLRAKLRERGEEPDALTLAGGLHRYSARGGDYVAEIRALIRSNGLNDLGPLRLARLTTVD